MEEYYVSWPSKKKTGEYKAYDIDGSLMTIANYKDNVKHGEVIEFCTKSSQPEVRYNYQTGELSGKVIGYYCNGSRRSPPRLERSYAQGDEVNGVSQC